MLISALFLNYNFSLTHKKWLLAFTFALLFLSTNLYADKSYIKCWKDEDGLTECGNRVPRKYYNQQIRYIDNTGITRKIKEKAKTKEELDAQRELLKLLDLEEKQKKKSADYDAVLLKTYLTIDDLLASLNSKLTLIKSQAAILDSTIALKKQEFSQLVRQAANMERSGKPISKQLSKQLGRVRKDLKNLQTQVHNNRLETTKIKKTFAHDVERFILSKSNRLKHGLTTAQQRKMLHAIRISCLSTSQCELNWKKANDFIAAHATTKVLYQTKKISVTDIPDSKHDIAMSLALLENKKNSKKTIIFQIRCTREREGHEFCASHNVNDLLTQFKTAVYR